MYLFQPRRSAERPSSDADPSDPSATPSTLSLHTALPSINTPALQPGSAAEWAIGELLIRLCNGGRSLRGDSPEPPTPE